jgi:hypothetical protein
MAKRTIELLVSDLSGDELEAGKGRTVNFSYDGTDYTIDLTDKEAAGFDKAVAMYIEHATKSGGRRATGTRKPSGSGRSKDELAEIRSWLREQGHDVPDRGRVKAELIEAYDAAH